MVYTFSNPVDVVISVIRVHQKLEKKAMKNYCDHLKVPYVNPEDLIYRDGLCLEEHFYSWLNEGRFPVAFVKYESMWENEEELSGYLGFPIVLPKFRKRKVGNVVSIEIRNILKNTYASLVR
jgi:hypothetical protein